MLFRSHAAAQLHQLRGRVGRGAKASVCVLIYTPPLSDTGKSRLKAMAETTDGFEIARRDLMTVFYDSSTGLGAEGLSGHGVAYRVS